MTNETKKTTKLGYKRTYDKLKKMTIITIVICIILFIATPILMFVNSKYKIIERNKTFGDRLDIHNEERTKNQTESHTINDIF